MTVEQLNSIAVLMERNGQHNGRLFIILMNILGYITQTIIAFLLMEVLWLLYMLHHSMVMF